MKPTFSTRSAVTITVLLALLACKGKKTADPQPAPVASATAAPAAPAAPAVEWITHAPSGTKFRAPPGWNKSKDEDTIVFVPPGGKAVLAFESYQAGTDPGGTIMAVARKLKLDDLDWKGGRKEMKFGKDAIPGFTAEGTCNYKGEQATYSYATLGSSGAKQILIIYAVTKSSPQERKHEAIETVKSLERA